MVSYFVNGRHKNLLKTLSGIGDQWKWCFGVTHGSEERNFGTEVWHHVTRLSLQDDNVCTQNCLVLQNLRILTSGLSVQMAKSLAKNDCFTLWTIMSTEIKIVAKSDSPCNFAFVNSSAWGKAFNLALNHDNYGSTSTFLFPFRMLKI